MIAHEDVKDQVVQISIEIQKSPKNAELYLRRGELYRVQRKWSLATADYDRAAQLDPEMNAVLLCRGKLFWDMGEPERAKAALDRFLTVQPDHAEALVSRARALIVLERHSEATADLTEALKIDPQPEYYIERARASAATRNFSDALAGLDEGIARLGNLVTLQVLAIDLELSRNNYRNAIRRVETILAQAERKEQWFSRLGDIQAQAGLMDDALQSYQAALAAIDNLPGHLRTKKATVTLQIEVQKKVDRIRAEREPVP